MHPLDAVPGTPSELALLRYLCMVPHQRGNVALAIEACRRPGQTFLRPTTWDGSKKVLEATLRSAMLLGVRRNDPPPRRIDGAALLDLRETLVKEEARNRARLEEPKSPFNEVGELKI